MYFKQFFATFKKVRQEYKAQQQLLKQKHTLLSAKTDWALLQEFIQSVNNNPDLRIEVHLTDGTTFLLKNYKAPERHTASQLINGDLNPDILGDLEGETLKVR